MQASETVYTGSEITPKGIEMQGCKHRSGGGDDDKPYHTKEDAKITQGVAPKPALPPDAAATPAWSRKPHSNYALTGSGLAYRGYGRMTVGEEMTTPIAQLY